MIYTGYFAKIKEYESKGLTPISIARYKPKWFNGEECKELAPSSDLLYRYKQGTADKDTYTKEFNAYLDGIDVKGIVEGIAKSRDIVLCCFEKPSDFCHRELVAKCLREKYNIKVSEWNGKENNEI